MAAMQAGRSRAPVTLRQWLGERLSRAAGKPESRKASRAWMGGGAMRAYMVMPGQPVWSDRDYSQFAIEAYVRNVVAHRSINMIASAAASVPFDLFATNSRGMRRELAAHPVLKLLRRPNPTQSGTDLLHGLYHYRMISGNAYVQGVGPKDAPPSELYLLRPDRVAVLAGAGALPSGYRYMVGDKAVDFPVDRLSGRSRLLHIKNFHPLNDWYGLSPVEAAAYSIDQHNQSGAWNQALLQNGARPSGALVVRNDNGGSGTLSEDQYTRIKMQMDEQFSGQANAGRPLLLEGGLDWKEMSLTPKDMDFIEGKNSAARDIALAFGVPPQLLGIPGDNRYANMQEARLALWEQTVMPLVQNTLDALNSWLMPMFDGQLELVANTDGISALAVRNQVIWDRVERANFLSDDEKRAAVGYPPRAPSATP
jgi:HK97 family phage portal protein